MNFDMGGVEQTVSSNTVRLVLAERLDVTVTAVAPTVVASGAADQAVAFRVANTGNGAETFALAGATEGGGASIVTLAVDVDGNGVYDPQVDRKLPDARLPLDAGAEAVVFVIVGGARVGAAISLTASATTGTGAPGTVFAGLGDGAGDAVVGASGATAQARTLLAAGKAGPSLTKSQSVVAPDGSAQPVKGAIITYQLDARFPGIADGVEIEDPIPAGTAYVPGSLTLDGKPLSDTADADAGRFDGTIVAVALGDIAPDPAGETIRAIRFQVTIQ